MPTDRIAIVGATGFTGSELVRLLHHHPTAEIALITSESRSGQRLADVHPFLDGVTDRVLGSLEDLSTADIDLAFLAVPHGVAMDVVKRLHETDLPIVDLSADYRLNDAASFEAWYGQEHRFPEAMKHAVYGLPELFRSDIPKRRLVANPGCYPTSILLALAPLVRAGAVNTTDLIADSKSGVTGAGAKSKPVNHFSTVHDDFAAYGLKTHRHTIEVQQHLGALTDAEVTVQFTPHLLPVDRGILSTIYARPLGEMNQTHLDDIFRTAYADEPFVRLRDRPPRIKDVRGTNLCDLHATWDERTGRILVLSAIDNLVKGAAGQAIQNMNLLLSHDEGLGLDLVPLRP